MNGVVHGVSACLIGLQFPANKQQIIDNAVTRKCPEPEMNYLNEIPDKSYKTPSELTTH